MRISSMRRRNSSFALDRLYGRMRKLVTRSMVAAVRPVTSTAVLLTAVVSR